MNGEKEKVVSPVQLTTSRTGNHTRLIHIPIHEFMHRESTWYHNRRQNDVPGGTTKITGIGYSREGSGSQ